MFAVFALIVLNVCSSEADINSMVDYCKNVELRDKHSRVGFERSGGNVPRLLPLPNSSYFSELQGRNRSSTGAILQSIYVMAEIAPIVLSGIVCDQVVVDPETRQVSIIDVVRTISAAEYPARHQRLCFFFELTDGHGEVDLTVKLVEVTNTGDNPIFKVSGKVKFEDARQVICQHMSFENVIFPRSGEYRFQLLVSNERLLERRIICRRIKIEDMV